MRIPVTIWGLRLQLLRSTCAACGHGGSGIPLSFLAARLLARMTDGRYEACDGMVALDRDPPKSTATVRAQQP